MKQITILNRHTKALIFTHECEDNTIIITLLAAIKAGADLEGAYLKGAYLDKTGLFQFCGNFGSVWRCTTFDSINDKVICGCFYDTMEAFKIAVIKKHGTSNQAIMYLGIIVVMEKINELKPKQI